jgi:hypothetical protein
MHSVEKVGGEWVGRDGKSRDFIRLPSGDYIKPAFIEAIRVSRDKADRATGAISAKVHVQHRDSWFSISFDHFDDAEGFAAALARLHEHVLLANHVTRTGSSEDLLAQAGLEIDAPPEGRAEDDE